MTTSLTSDQVQVLENLCNKLCNEPKIRFCGVITPLGRLVTGGFRDGVKPLDNEDQRRMLYTQSTLELSIKKEFDDNLGNVNFITTYRDNVVLITIPIQQNHLVLISAERNTDVGQIVKDVMTLFENNSLFGKRDRMTLSNDSNFSECVP